MSMVMDFIESLSSVGQLVTPLYCGAVKSLHFLIISRRHCVKDFARRTNVHTWVWAVGLILFFLF
jgi:hypothetical protein